MHTNRHYSSKVGNLPLLKSCYHHPSAPQSTTATINKTRALEQGCLNHMLAFHRVCHLFMATGGAPHSEQHRLFSRKTTTLLKLVLVSDFIKVADQRAFPNIISPIWQRWLNIFSTQPLQIN